MRTTIENDCCLENWNISFYLQNNMEVNLEVKSKIETVSGHYELDTETLEEKCFITIKSKFKLKYGKHYVERELSNTIQITEPEIMKAMRDASNKEELDAIMEKKNRPVDWDKRINI